MGRHWTETEWDQAFYDMYVKLQNHATRSKENPELKPLTQRKLSALVGITYQTLADGLARHGLPTIPKQGLLEALRDYLLDKQIFKAQEAALVFTDTKKADDVDWREFVDLAETNQIMGKRLQGSQKIANIAIKTDLPIAVMFTSDWHLGDSGTDHLTWKKDVEFLLETPRLYMVDLGDDRQNARTFRILANVLEQVLSPKQQALLMRNLIDELTREDKMLAKIGGNHDEEWDERIFGEAMMRYLAEKMKAPRFRNRGLLKLTVGKQLYTLLMFHKSRFKSFLRKTHGAMREYQLSYPADIVAGGHDHEPGMEHHHHYRLAAEAGMGFGGETLLIKTGTYQDSDFGWRYFHNGGFPTNYTVVLYPDQKKMVAFPDPRDAVHYMNNL